MVSTAGQPAGQRRGVWEPLPRFIYGYAVHSLSPSGRRDTRLSSRTRISTFTDASGDDNLVHRDVVSLEVGDEVYAFERYIPKDKEVEGIWYRGYVVCTSRRPPVIWTSPADPSGSTGQAQVKVDEAQQVFLGIFPASHIFVRDELSDAEGRLADIAAMFHNVTNGTSTVKDLYAQWTRDKPPSDAPSQDDDDADTQSVAPGRKSFKLNPPADQANSTRARLPVYPASIRSASPTPTESQVQKPLPPRPSLPPGGETASGLEQPIVDEIASALREWHMLMFQYLARRDYKLFQVVREQIEALHLGRRQLLSKTLSSEETVNLRRQCVARLVRGNIMQSLDIIVRHPTWGGLVTVDVEGELDPRSWISAVRMYAMQVSLAYMDVSPSNASEIPRLGASIDYVPTTGPQPSPAPSAFADASRSRNTRSLGSLGNARTYQPARAKFYHVMLEVRAFVANICAPGETVELFFSLYNQAQASFVSEEFCVVLNHNGSLARDPTQRIRTLFTDIVASDANDPIFLICSIVRNGAMKMGSSMGSIAESKRSSELSAHRESSASSAVNGWVDASDYGTKSDSPSHFRRPFGSAVLELKQVKQMATEGVEISSTREHTMPIYVPTNEAAFSMLHQDILNNNTKEFEKSSRADHLAVSIKVFYGDADTIVRENSSLLHDTPLTLRLGFPDVVFPGDTRNELYIKLWNGDFSSTQTSTARRSFNFTRGHVNTVSGNVQVTMEVRGRDGRAIPNVITRCSGEPEISCWNSMVFQRTSQPTFNELLKVKLPSSGAQEWHLFFTFKKRDSRDRSSSRNATDTAERPFAFAFLPLFPDRRAFLEDGEHMLALYQADRLNQLSPDLYLDAAPWLIANQKLDQVSVPVEMQRVAPILKDHLMIRSSLCSTKFTQNSVLLSLLNWQGIADKEFLSTILAKFTFVGEVEIVKFLRDIFDALFAILVSPVNQGSEMDHLVFNAIVTVLGIIQDRRFSNFQPVLDVYIGRHFSCSAASSHMIHSMNRLLQNPTSGETASCLRAALKVWHYVFKFIARARELQKQKDLGIAGGATAETLEQAFKNELRAHLGEVTRMMSTTAPASIIGTQTIALQHFTSILPELHKVFSVMELVHFVTTFANAVVTTKGKVVIWKLIMYLQIVRGFLFDVPQSRAALVEAVVLWIKPHFGRFDEYLSTQPGDSESAKDAARISWLESVRLSVTVVAVMLDKIQQSLVNPSIVADRNLLRQEHYNIEYLLSLFPQLLESYLEFQHPANERAIERTKSPTTTPSSTPITFPESYPFALLSQLPKSLPASASSPKMYNAGLGESAVVLLALALSSPKKFLLGIFENVVDIEGRDKLTALLSKLFKVAGSILNNDAFPCNWLNVNILAHKVLIKIFDPVGTILEREYIPNEANGATFDPVIWREAFYVLLRLLSSEQLKRRTVWRLAGDIRGEGAAILLRLWQALGWQIEETASMSSQVGNYQVALHTLVGQVVNLCLSNHDQLRTNAVHMLYCMIVTEYHVSGHFDEIENELVSKLDTLFMTDNKRDDISRAFFIGHLRHLFDSSDIDSDLRTRVTGFLDSVDLFLELLLSVRALPEGEEFADDRVIATLRLMNFIRRIGKDEIYIKYVHQLVNMHLQAQNYVEAALTLKLHADLHDWDLNTFAPPMEDLGLPQQSQFHRKETLCLLILDYLGKGKAWESALEICKELSFQHAEVTFNYARLAEILRHQAALLEHIVTDQRYYSDYFRVAFYGNFPVGIRNKQFVYRGYEWEKFGAFCERMLNKHPGARLLKSIGDPPVDIRFGSDQYIQCTAVVPEPNRELPIFTNPDVPPQIRTYYEHSAINLFSYTRQISKHGPDGSEEVWLEKTYLTTEEAFPTVLRRSEVVEVSPLEISPVEMALQEVQQRTRELEAMHIRYAAHAALAKTGQIVSTNPLAMTLNAVVDAPVDTGVASFRELFLTGDYASRFPDRVEQVEKLRAAIDDQVRIIDSCLKLHGQLCPPEMLAFHSTLESFFRKNFQDEILRLAVEAQPPDPSLRAAYAHLGTPTRHLSVIERRSLEPPLELGHALSRAPSVSPGAAQARGHSPVDGAPSAKQTPLQRGLAYLARHGFNGVASGPGDSAGSDVDEASPHDSYMNGAGSPMANLSGAASITGSTVGSMGGSLRGRFSRFGSLNFGRRDG
ncbi:cytoplasmic protein [Phanerochaete sordida]|uniref:Cytoplasmic protein n=1 Tax=Phanerochaete sordida TaxID=48140 RepID=A0A9P3LJZ6_9APHY|nr:cytoplasmic protein [Phanerochaete sordida]